MDTACIVMKKPSKFGNAASSVVRNPEVQICYSNASLLSGMSWELRLFFFWRGFPCSLHRDILKAVNFLVMQF